MFSYRLIEALREELKLQIDRSVRLIFQLNLLVAVVVLAVRIEEEVAPLVGKVFVDFRAAFAVEGKLLELFAGEVLEM